MLNRIEISRGLFLGKKYLKRLVIVEDLVIYLLERFLLPLMSISNYNTTICDIYPVLIISPWSIEVIHFSLK